MDTAAASLTLNRSRGTFAEMAVSRQNKTGIILSENDTYADRMTAREEVKMLLLNIVEVDIFFSREQKRPER